MTIVESIGVDIEDKALHCAGICRHTEYLKFAVQWDYMTILASNHCTNESDHNAPYMKKSHSA